MESGVIFQGKTHAITITFPIELAPQELRDVAPKISKMHSNLEVLLTGESEANSYIDQVRCPVTIN